MTNCDFFVMYNNNFCHLLNEFELDIGECGSTLMLEIPLSVESKLIL